MGGYGSTRWGTMVTRVSTAGLPRLDVSVLARQGALRPGARSNVTWGTGTAITVEVPEDDDEVMCLAYGVQMRGRAGATVAEHVRLMRTPCTFGAFRVWPSVCSALRAGGPVHVPIVSSPGLCQHAAASRSATRRCTPRVPKQRLTRGW